MAAVGTPPQKGQVVKVPDGSGPPRLETEKQFDPTIGNFVEQNGEPDYILVESRQAVQLIYIDDDRIIRFQRSGIWPNSRALVTDGIPDALGNLFTIEDKNRLRQSRAQKIANTESVPPSE
jgi:hypothetical protein